MKRLKTAAANAIYFAIQLTKQIFCIPSGTCRHIPSCSQFARTAIIELPAHVAIFRIIARLLRCHPFGTWGYDPVLRDEKIIQRIK
ncbi:MAG: membrane protein insertion efficiency factor YidD [Chitinivibrionia bacterium]|nr:membrane protein insertion efficiency factor YidD [Chitinivibrionia bacterium]